MLGACNLLRMCVAEMLFNMRWLTQWRGVWGLCKPCGKLIPAVAVQPAQPAELCTNQSV